jgi:hypothetical protein
MALTDVEPVFAPASAIDRNAPSNAPSLVKYWPLNFGQHTYALMCGFLSRRKSGRFASK